MKDLRFQSGTIEHLNATLAALSETHEVKVRSQRSHKNCITLVIEVNEKPNEQNIQTPVHEEQKGE